MKKILSNKVAIVTGSSSGIGKEIAVTLANNGAHVVITSRICERAKKIAEEIVKQGGSAMPCSFELEDHHSGELLLAATSKKFNKIDILINNAINRSSISPNCFSELQYDNLESSITANLTNTIHLTSQAYPYLKSSKGTILNIGSVILNRHIEGLLLYSIVKGAISRLTKGLASEWARDRIRINQINPGVIETDSMNERHPKFFLQEYKNYLQSLHPLGRIGKGKDIAELAMYMVSDEAQWMTGAIIDMDGGYSNQGIRSPLMLPQKKERIQIIK